MSHFLSVMPWGILQLAVYSHFNVSNPQFPLPKRCTFWPKTLLSCAANDCKSLSSVLRDCLLSHLHKSVQTSLNRQCCFAVICWYPWSFGWTEYYHVFPDLKSATLWSAQIIWYFSQTLATYKLTVGLCLCLIRFFLFWCFFFNVCLC